MTDGIKELLLTVERYCKNTADSCDVRAVLLRARRSASRRRTLVLPWRERRRWSTSTGTGFCYGHWLQHFHCKARWRRYCTVFLHSTVSQHHTLCQQLNTFTIANTALDIMHRGNKYNK